MVYKDKQSIDGWGSVADPDADCKIAEAGGKLTIDVPGEYHDLTHGPGITKLNAPRVWQDVQGDFTLQVCLLSFPVPEPGTSSSGKTSTQCCGLLVWKDDSNFIRFERHAFGQQLRARVEWFQDGKSTLTKAQVITHSADKKLYLRIVRKASDFAFEFKGADGEQAWTTVHAQQGDLPTKLKVGVHAINTVKQVFAPQLEDFKLAVLPTIIAGWGTALDPDGDCAFAVNKGALAITVPKVAHDLFNGFATTSNYGMFNAPRILQDVQGDFSVQVKTSAFPRPALNSASHSRGAYVSAGLVIWSDEKNFFRLDSAAGAGLLKSSIYLERFVDGRRLPTPFWALSNKDIYLKVERQGNQFTFAFKDGSKDKAWEGNSQLTAAMPSKLKVGVFAINFTNTPFTAPLQELELSEVHTTPLTLPLLSVPSPLALSEKLSAADHFKREDIPAEVLAKMGSGKGDAPQELVAVLGEAGEPQVVSLSLSRDGLHLAAGALHDTKARLFDLAAGGMKTIGDAQTRGHLVALEPGW